MKRSYDEKVLAGNGASSRQSMQSSTAQNNIIVSKSKLSTSITQQPSNLLNERGIRQPNMIRGPSGTRNISIHPATHLPSKSEMVPVLSPQERYLMQSSITSNAALQSSLQNHSGITGFTSIKGRLIQQRTSADIAAHVLGNQTDVFQQIASYNVGQVIPLLQQHQQESMQQDSIKQTAHKLGPGNVRNAIDVLQQHQDIALLLGEIHTLQQLQGVGDFSSMSQQSNVARLPIWTPQQLIHPLYPALSHSTLQQGDMLEQIMTRSNLNQQHVLQQFIQSLSTATGHVHSSGQVFLPELDVSNGITHLDNAISTTKAPDSLLLKPLSLPILLSNSCTDLDRMRLSDHQYLLRQQIELFEADEDDVAIHIRGRNKPITLGQVGIRCKHCAHISVSLRQKGSTYYPSKINGIYQAAQNMSTTHIQCGLCNCMPLNIKLQFVRIMESLNLKINNSNYAGRPYWSQRLTQMGYVDTEEHGIRSISTLPSDAVVVAVVYDIDERKRKRYIA